MWLLLNRWLCNKTNGNKRKCYKLLLGLLIERGLSTNGHLKRAKEVNGLKLKRTDHFQILRLLRVRN